MQTEVLSCFLFLFIWQVFSKGLFYSLPWLLINHSVSPLFYTSKYYRVFKKWEQEKMRKTQCCQKDSESDVKVRSRTSFNKLVSYPMYVLPVASPHRTPGFAGNSLPVQQQREGCEFELSCQVIYFLSIYWCTASHTVVCICSRNYF